MKPTTIIPFATVALAAPSCKPSCNQLSSAASVSITGFATRASYIFSTPAHQNSHGYVDFNLTSSVTDLTTLCSATSSQLSNFFYGTLTYTCDDGTTGFTYNAPSRELGIEADWNCAGKHGGEGTNWVGTALQALELECEETYYQNPNWTMGQIYSDREINCNAPTTQIVLDANML